MVSAIKTALAALELQIAGVVHAWAQGPNALNASDLPAFVNLSGAATQDWNMEGGGEGVETRQYRLLLYVLPYGQGVPGEGERACEPFLDSVPKFFAGRPALGTKFVFNAYPNRDSGLTILTYAGPDDRYWGIEFGLTVISHLPYEYGSNE